MAELDDFVLAEADAYVIHDPDELDAWIQASDPVDLGEVA